MHWPNWRNRREWLMTHRDIRTDSSIVLDWRLYGMPTTTTHDYSATKNTGTSDCAASGYPGFYFTGAGNTIQGATTYLSTIQGSHTLMAWIKLDDGRNGAAQGIGHNVNAASEDGVALYVDATGHLTVTYLINAAGTTVAETAASFPLGQDVWRCVGAVTTTVTGLFVDGAVVKSGAIPSRAAMDTDQPWVCGLNYGGGPLVGYMSRMVIWNRALSVVEIKNAYELTRWRYRR